MSEEPEIEFDEETENHLLYKIEQREFATEPECDEVFDLSEATAVEIVTLLSSLEKSLQTKDCSDEAER